MGIFISYANLLIAILMRQELVINTLFTLACAVPQTWPFRIRKLAARMYHHRGIHFGAAVSGTFWLILLAVQATRELASNKGVVLLTNDHRDHKILGNALVHSAPFWLMVVLSCSLFLPWIKLQKVPVRSVVLSDHAVQTFVDYGIKHRSSLLFFYLVFIMPSPVPGSFQRFSTDPLYEWHSFVTISISVETGFSIIISQVGDWPTEMINNPPKEI
ncbi:hypothetical protein DFS33DRAFT_1384419 [Desarmillaria ectypa]|nr:hypothetical protein DFS33DRAFT_1384419 [Desarmillaria ectypa]